jgi:hypothetical protein
MHHRRLADDSRMDALLRLTVTQLFRRNNSCWFVKDERRGRASGHSLACSPLHLIVEDTMLSGFHDQQPWLTFPKRYRYRSTPATGNLLQNL